MPKFSYLKAINRALGDEMDRDPDVFVLGEDINLALAANVVGGGARFLEFQEYVTSLARPLARDHDNIAITAHAADAGNPATHVFDLVKTRDTGGRHALPVVFQEAQRGIEGVDERC